MGRRLLDGVGNYEWVEGFYPQSKGGYEVPLKRLSSDGRTTNIYDLAIKRSRC